MKVCAVCGAEVVQNRTSRWVHIQEIPEGIDPEHVADPIDRADYEAKVTARQNLTDALLTLLRHHDVLCPDPACEWRKVARRALGMPV
jgi:hypothetical protein